MSTVSIRLAFRSAPSTLFQAARRAGITDNSVCHPRYRCRRSLSTISCVAVSPTMKYNRLGSSDLIVSEVCLGTMTWGMQNTEADAHEQIDYARSCGINFLDMAELYPVPTSAPGQVPGTTERYVGSYLAKHPEVRSELIIATKIAGFGKNSQTAAYRTDPPTKPYPDARLDKKNIHAACESSLRRLQTDYIDLYQLHWPDRYVANFNQRTYDPSQEHESVPIRDTLLALKELLDSGKIRAYGLSNESTFGLCEFVRLADEIGMPRPATIQNPFCLFNREFESDLAEACAPRNYNVGLLPWSILAGGALSGKYLGKVDENGKITDPSLKDSRHYRFPQFQGRFLTKETIKMTEKYNEIAKEGGMSLTTLAHAFCKSRWYIPSTIIGATKMEQLKENIAAFDVDLDEKILKKIDAVHNMNKDIIVRA